MSEYIIVDSSNIFTLIKSVYAGYEITSYHKDAPEIPMNTFLFRQKTLISANYNREKTELTITLTQPQKEVKFPGVSPDEFYKSPLYRSYPFHES